MGKSEKTPQFNVILKKSIFNPIHIVGAKGIPLGLEVFPLE